jgi:hypothetical protein
MGCNSLLLIRVPDVKTEEGGRKECVERRRKRE